MTQSTPISSTGPPAVVWTVSQLTRRVKNTLEASIGRVWVSGEISNFRASPTGHAYFTLKDDRSQLSAVMFKGQLGRLRFEPENGLEVVVHGLLTVYEQRGAYQIVCESMQPKGMGALQLAYEKLKQKLSQEGLFDDVHKKPLPMLPRRIGVVTSPTGAAIRDILNVIQRRFAGVHVLIYPVRVQGDGAAREIVEGIRALDNHGVDVMIVGRGGGSLEDLWAFNEEPVVRAVFEAKTPVISAVGHEIDFSLSDFAADVRAPTPSAAAELVVREYEALAKGVRLLEQRLFKGLQRRVETLRGRVERATAGYIFRRPEELVRQRRQRCDELRMQMEGAMRSRLGDARHRIDKARRAVRHLSPVQQIRRARERLIGRLRRLLLTGPSVLDRSRGQLRLLEAQLDALSPLAILSRGYALAWNLPEERLVRSSRELSPEDELRLRFGEGHATAVVKSIEE